MMKKLFCFGYGYVAAHLSHTLRNSGEDWKVEGTTQDPDKRQRLRNAGITTYLFHEDKPLTDPLYYLGDATHILMSVPPDDYGDPVFDAHAEDILRVAENVEWIGYLSSTSVYGDRNGEWVDETAEKRPSSKRGTRRVKGEDQWLSLKRKNGLPVHVFRLAGIYGPRRSAIDTLRAGAARRINKPGHAFSRIHVDDIVAVLLASFAKPNPGSVYNVADDDPSQSHEVIEFACQLLGMDPPPLLDYEDLLDLSPMARSFYRDNKRIVNDKIKNELGVKFKYPSFKTGLQACLESEEDNLIF